METISDGCRLCLDPFAENFATTESPQLKEQMEKVFSFVIESKPGCSTSVCQSCWYTISEFYKYSEKVRQNQELLNGNATTVGPSTEDCKLPFENIKVEPTMPSDDDFDDSTAVSVELIMKSEFPNEAQDPSAAVSDDSCKLLPRKKKPQTGKRRGRPRKRKAEDSESADEKPKKREKPPARPQEEIDKEDQLLNEHFRMVCELCGVAAPNFNLLHSHFRRIHKRRIGYVTCCNKKLFKRRSLLDHMAFHANPDAFRCTVCSKRYKNKETLDIHTLDMHSSEDQRPFKCDHCPQSFARKNALALHMESHQKFECSQCDKLLSSKQALKTHIVNMHSDKDRLMVCDTCGQEFRTKQCFDRHVDDHMGIVKRFQCNICHRWLKGERNFQNHMNFIHAQQGQLFKCDICQQDYPNLRALQSHKRAVHAEAKHECEFCGKKFRKAVALREHRTTHTGEVLYSCEVCGVAKNSKANLYAHVKQRHPVEYAAKKLRTEQANASQIEPKQGYGSNVCRRCSDTISEFYQFSEKVRQNQETLDERSTKIELPIKSEVSVENAKIEPTTDPAELFVEPIATEDADERYEATSEEEQTVQHPSDDDSCEPPPPKKTQSKRTKGHLPRKPKSEDANPKEDACKPKEARDKEDQFLTEHFRLACPLCDETVSTFLQIHVHFWQVHDLRDAYVVCCDRKFTDRSTILEHTYKHFNESLRCVVCGEQFLNKQELSTHLSEGKSRYTCDRCPISFKQKCAFDAHMDLHWGRLRCLECNQYFAKRISFSKHMNYHHSGKDRPIIDRKVRTQADFKKPMNAQKLDIQGTRFQCEICQRWLKGEQNYRVHVDRVHGPIAKSFQCDICQQVFPHEQNLCSHKRQVHVEAKHGCEFCGKRFKKQISLKEHRTIHTGEMLYQCEFCKYRCNRNSSFYLHMTKKHPVEWTEKKLKSMQASGLIATESLV